MKKRELKKGEWFVASENGINKFKHSVKTFFIFVFLPVFVLQAVSAYFILGYKPTNGFFSLCDLKIA